ncbi:Hypothetical_protein [Hexamita inflata]|uniref:Hypothetical_protein n=1 Tax=Hexamita inflata TaxID=28002 RepID=A0AA86R0S3_9EUKA|nr:Hypothetical protein HINF_LOCUS55790 [Hexamita inflata]
MFIKVQRIKQICLQVYNYLSVGYLSETSWESVIPNLEQTGQIQQILLHTRYGVYQHIQSIYHFLYLFQNTHSRFVYICVYAKFVQSSTQRVNLRTRLSQARQPFRCLHIPPQVRMNCLSTRTIYSASSNNSSDFVQYQKNRSQQLNSQLISSKLMSYDSDINMNVSFEIVDTRSADYLRMLLNEAAEELQNLGKKVEYQEKALGVFDRNYEIINKHAKWIIKNAKKI